MWSVPVDYNSVVIARNCTNCPAVGTSDYHLDNPNAMSYLAYCERPVSRARALNVPKVPASATIDGS